ncbi:MAG: AbrB/MazE/SpoVT family DNA-binding domain-containing protein [Bacillota bacterium]|jgi:AbrB family looped-hinge helix DNA binding protein
MNENKGRIEERVNNEEPEPTLIKSRFIDSGWRLTIPKAIRDRLGWAPGTPICVSYDGIDIIVKCPTTCTDCPDVVRMGSLGKVVLPPRVRAEANLYRGQVMTLSVEDGRVLVKSGDSQVRCKACGSEMDVKEELANVHLCRRCRESLQKAAVRAVTWR